MKHTIIENGRDMGEVTDDGGYGFEYRGAYDSVGRVLEEKAGATVVDSGSGPGGATAERLVEADEGEKLRQAVRELSAMPQVRLEPRAEETLDAPEGADGPDEAAEKAAGLLERFADRVFR